MRRSEALGIIYDSPSLAIDDRYVNFSAVFGDALLLNTGGYLRSLAGVDGSVDVASTSYRAGGWTSFALGTGRIGYAAIAKGYSLAAPSGVAASAFRTQLKTLFRFGAAKNWRPPNLAKYATDAELRAAAGRTNPYINAYGAGVSVSGASSGSCLSCED